MRRAVTVISSLLIAQLHAQHSGFGLKAGLVMSGTKSGEVSTRMIPGGTIGAYFALRAGPRMELQPEARLTTLGYGFTLPDGDRGSTRLLYAQVPVAAKLYIGNTFNAAVGVQMGRLLVAQQIVGGESTTVTDSYEKWDHGLILGVGADMVSGVDLCLRYYSGLRPINREDDIYLPRNRAWLLTVGYRLGRVRSPKFTRRRG